MKVGILSLILNTNYGGILQSYALQTVIERLGHNVKVIDRDFIPEISYRAMIKELPKRFIKKYILRKNISLWPQQHYDHLQYGQKSAEIRSFIFRNIHIRKCKSLSRLYKNEFDAIVVGSDQVWRPSYFIGWGNIHDAYLYFARNWNIRRISYAASFGTDAWEYNEQQTDEIRKLIHKFDRVSVRESVGVNLCRKFLGIEAVHVLDPTFLLSCEDYEKLIDQEPTSSITGTMFTYMLDDDDEKKAFIDKISQERNLVPFKINKFEIMGDYSQRKSVELWLKAFRDATFIVTDSFHACVFAVIFHKPFICICNRNRGLSRFYTLIKELELTNNIIFEYEQYIPSHDYGLTECTYQRLQALKEKSINFLLKNLQ